MDIRRTHKLDVFHANHSNNDINIFRSHSKLDLFHSDNNINNNGYIFGNNLDVLLEQSSIFITI